MTRQITKEDFLHAYMNTHSNKRGESYQTNSDRLFEWLRANDYILTNDR